MSGVAHEPVVQRKLLNGKNVLKAVVPELAADRLFPTGSSEFLHKGLKKYSKSPFHACASISIDAMFPMMQSVSRIRWRTLTKRKRPDSNVISRGGLNGKE